MINLRVIDIANEYLSWGAGPRASQNLILAAKTKAMSEGRFNITEEDIKFLAVPVLRHRIIPNYTAEAQGLSSVDIIDKILVYYSNIFMEFVGFQHSFPVYLILLIWLGCIALILRSYYANKKLGAKEKLGLSLLRCISITILLLLLLNPVFFGSDLKKSPQNVMILLDTSESMNLNKGEYKGASTYRNVLDKLQQLEPQLNVECINLVILYALHLGLIVWILPTQILD